MHRHRNRCGHGAHERGAGPSLGSERVERAGDNQEGNHLQARITPAFRRLLLKTTVEQGPAFPQQPPLPCPRRTAATPRHTAVPVIPYPPPDCRALWQGRGQHGETADASAARPNQTRSVQQGEGERKEALQLPQGTCPAAAGYSRRRGRRATAQPPPARIRRARRGARIAHPLAALQGGTSPTTTTTSVVLVQQVQVASSSSCCSCSLQGYTRARVTRASERPVAWLSSCSCCSCVSCAHCRVRGRSVHLTEARTNQRCGRADEILCLPIRRPRFTIHGGYQMRLPIGRTVAPRPLTLQQLILISGVLDEHAATSTTRRVRT